jgi:ribosomal protein L11 methyltransferase
MNRQWQELVLEVSRDEAEAWADAFLEAGALSVQAEDADADSPDEQPLFGEPLTPGQPGALAGPASGPASGAVHGAAFGWERTRLAVLLDNGDDGAALLVRAAATRRKPLPATLSSRTVEDQDWVRATQAQFEPIPIGERLLIVPSWRVQEALQREDRRVALVIDPGLAFGTGSHPTTHMCLEWLEQADLAGKRVIDYGCGSGILAIAAARLGSAEVTGIDIDPQALVSAAENARLNDVAIAVQSSSDALPEPAQVVVANILSNPLKLLAPMLVSLVAPGGTLVLSGVLERQIEEVSQFYGESLPVAPWRVRDGWVCLVGRSG